MTADWQETAFETRAIHAGQEPDPTTGAITTPIYQTSTFVQKGIDELGAYEYGRTHNPTRTALQDVVASLEGGRLGTRLRQRSGRNPEHLLPAGSRRPHRPHRRRLRRHPPLRGQGHQPLRDRLHPGRHERPGADPRRHPARDPAHLGRDPDESLPQDRRYPGRGRPDRGITRRCLSSTTPLPRRICRTRWRSAPISCCTPAPSTSAVTPTWSAVSWSATTRRSTRRSSSIRTRAARCRARSTAGSSLRGIKTLPVRMERHSRNGLAVAEFLRDHPAVRQVFYPGLPDHPGHDVAARQMRDFSGMVSFTVRGDFQTAAEVARSTQDLPARRQPRRRRVADRAPRPDDARQRGRHRGRGRGHPAAPLGRHRERGGSHRRSAAGPRGGRSRDGRSVVSPWASRRSAPIRTHRRSRRCGRGTHARRRPRLASWH